MTKKIALISDTHWGCRNDSSEFHNYFRKYLNEVFFPRLKKEGIKQVIHLGDIVDKRKTINFLSVSHLINDFLKPMREMGIDFDLIIGNHDSYYKNRIDVNVGLVIRDYAKNIIDVPKVKEYCDREVLLLPWICQDNYDMSMDMIMNNKASIVMGHLELSGFRMNKTSISSHGFSPSLFSHYDLVLSGHYHSPSCQNNIHYIGSPFEITWADADEERGAIILNMEDLSMERIVNPFKMFHRLTIDDIDNVPDTGFVEFVVESEDDMKILESREKLLDSRTKIKYKTEREVVTEDVDVEDTPDLINKIVPEPEVRQFLIEVYNKS